MVKKYNKEIQSFEPKPNDALHRFLLFGTGFRSLWILIALSCVLTLVQLFTIISLNYQLIIIQIIIIPHWAASIFLEKVKIISRSEQLRAGMLIGAITELLPAILLSITEAIRFLSPQYNDLYHQVFNVGNSPNDIAILLGIIGATVFIGILLVIVSALFGFLAALSPIRNFLGRMNIG
jgi:hypothetical protein